MILALAKMNLENPEQNEISTVVSFCTFLRIENMKKIKRHLFCQGPTKPFFSSFFLSFFVRERSKQFILFFLFRFSTELKEIRDFGSMLPNGIVERRETKS